MFSDSDIARQLVKQAVRDALSIYCRAMDRRDEQLAAGVWHADGTADYGPIFRGTGAGFATWVTNVHGHLDRHSHQITNVLTEVVADDVAVSEAYVTVVLWTVPDGEERVTQITSRGRYLDRWELRDGRWAIAARQYVDDLTSMQPLSSAERGGIDPSSRRDPTDPVYALFGATP
ncbi:MAG: hypothetical protein JWM34_4453 [Ilumatobacteraceae bacterium]|nr:hypothetical protein [Ilumatobacteraceae bacterium]